MLYSVYTNSIIDNIDLIEKIKIFLQEDAKILDFVIFTDEIEYGVSNHSILSTFYMIAYRGNIIFLNLDDYFSYKDNLLAKPILYLDSNNASTLDKSMIKNCLILTEANNQLQWVKNYEL